jgi:hypothetical protein
VSEAAAPVETATAEPSEARYIESSEARAIEAPEVARFSEPALRGSFEIVGGYDEHAPAREEPISHPPAAEAREAERTERMNLAATFASEEAETEAEASEEREPQGSPYAAGAEVIEEEIEGEEGDLPFREEELGDAELEEMMEEQTLTPAGEHVQSAVESNRDRSPVMSRAEAVAGEEMDFGDDEGEEEEEEAEGEEEESEAGLAARSAPRCVARPAPCRARRRPAGRTAAADAAEAAAEPLPVPVDAATSSAARVLRSPTC